PRSTDCRWRCSRPRTGAWSWSASPSLRLITTIDTTTATPMSADPANPHLGWNVLRDVGELVEYHFMVNALLAGAIVAVMSAAVGWVMVLRRQTFAGHTLSMMAFPGASAATLAGLPVAWGYFAFCGAGALIIGRVGGSERRTWSEESASIGAFQAVALDAGFLFVSLYGGVLGDLDSLLFGDVLGISDGQVLVLASVAAASLAVLVVLARPLLFASVDPDVAGAPGGARRALSGGVLPGLGLGGGGARAGSVGGVPRGPRAGGGCDQPDHGSAARLRVAPDAGGERPDDHRATDPKPRADAPVRRRRHLARPGDLLLLGLSGGVLHRDDLLRRLRAGARRGGAARRAPGAAGGSDARGWRDRLMLSQEFMRNALLAGTFVALACGVSGWFVVLRGQVFAGDALSHVAFPGALAAAAAGVDQRLGLVLATVIVGAGIGVLGRATLSGRGGGVALAADDTAIGIAF